MTTDNQTLKTQVGAQLARLIASEMTIKVLVILVERTASPKEIADLLGTKTPNVSHHVKKLLDMGLIELVKEREVGGAIQHIYRAVMRPIVDDDEWARLSLDAKHRFSVWIAQMLITDLAVSFHARLFDARPNNHLSRTPLLVDNEGVGEVAAIQNRALSEILEVEVTSAHRRVKSNEPAIHLIAGMMCFELPGPSEGLSRVARQDQEG